MIDYNTPDHHIANTPHATLHFSDGTKTVIADWEITEQAPTPDGTVYANLRGWIANTTGTGSIGSPVRVPVPDGKAHLALADLRGREPLTELDVECDTHSPSRPHPNTWDHAGVLLTLRWKARQLQAA